MERIKKKKLPYYIQQSPIFEDIKSKEYVYIPKEIFENINIKINNFEDYKKFLETSRYFQIIPLKLRVYHSLEKNQDEVLEFLLSLRSEPYIKDIIKDVKYFIKHKEKLKDISIKFEIDFGKLDVDVYDKTYNNLQIITHFSIDNFLFKFSNNIYDLIDLFKKIISLEDFEIVDQEDILRIYKEKNTIDIYTDEFGSKNNIQVITYKSLDEQNFIENISKLKNKLKKISKYFEKDSQFSSWMMDKKRKVNCYNFEFKYPTDEDQDINDVLSIKKSSEKYLGQEVDFIFLDEYNYFNLK